MSSLSKDEHIFYNRHLLLEKIGESGQLALKKSRVLVIGAGGLGCPLLVNLTGAGVGHIGIVDGDKVTVSNLHRQTLYGHSMIGRLKTEAAIERLKDINHFVQFKGFCEYLGAANALDIISDYDVIVDATDNFPVRYLINDACVIANKPCVFASIDRFQGQLSVLNYKGGPTYRCIFPKPPDPQTAPGCAQVGVLGVVTAVMGSLQANEVVKLLTGAGQLLCGRILTVDLLYNQFYSVGVEKDENAVRQVLDLKAGVNDSEYLGFCDSAEKPFSISVEEVMRKIEKMDNFIFVDVREKNEQSPIEKSLKIPLSHINKKINTVDRNTTLILYCEKGVDSLKAAVEFKKNGIKNVYSLLGGLKAWQAYKEKVNN